MVTRSIGAFASRWKKHEGTFWYPIDDVSSRRFRKRCRSLGGEKVMHRQYRYFQPCHLARQRPDDRVQAKYRARRRAASKSPMEGTPLSRRPAARVSRHHLFAEIPRRIQPEPPHLKLRLAPARPSRLDEQDAARIAAMLFASERATQNKDRRHFSRSSKPLRLLYENLRRARSFNRCRCDADIGAAENIAEIALQRKGCSGRLHTS